MTDTTSPASSLPANATSGVSPSVDIADALRWALYLGMSWTWVIGMFLPVLLIRDFGPWAWFAFAIPNVVGSAAMGWTIRSVEHSARLIANHRVATRTFSLVTIAFHIFFLLWIVPQLVGWVAAAIAFGVALVVMANILTTRLREAALAAVPLAISLVVAMVAAGRGSLMWPSIPNDAAPLNVLGLVGVCAMGFLTCPYLDLTFHRARQACRVQKESQIAFGVGFGLVFGSMIVFTLFYAAGLLSQQLDRVFAALIGIHICGQAIYTCGIHAAALRDSSLPAEQSESRNGLGFWLTIAAAAGVGLISQSLGAHGHRIGPLVIGELVYRAFMGFYGLLVPTYVWLCVHPGRGFVKPHRRELRMTALASALAAPFFCVAFIVGPMAWVTPGVVIIVCARFALDYGRRDLLAEQRAAMLKPTDPR